MYTREIRDLLGQFSNSETQEFVGSLLCVSIDPKSGRFDSIRRAAVLEQLKVSFLRQNHPDESVVQKIVEKMERGDALIEASRSYSIKDAGLALLQASIAIMILGILMTTSRLQTTILVGCLFSAYIAYEFLRGRW